jgi:DNA-binding SARP family transcriptional activator
MHFRVLGPLEVTQRDHMISLGGIKQRATLGFLLLQHNRVVATSALMNALWLDDIPASARKIIQNSVSGLRRVLRTDDPGNRSVRLSTRVPGYMLSVDPDQIDFARFQRLAGDGRAKLTEGAPDAAAGLLREAMSLWRGPVLADLVESGVNWPELSAVQDTRLDVLEDYFEAELACGRHRDVLGELEMLAGSETTRERLTGQLMIALYRCGRHTDALSAYRRLRAALVEEQGLEPSRELRELEQAILNHDASLGATTQTPIEINHAPAIIAAKPEPAPRPEPADRDFLAVERKDVSVLMVRLRSRVADVEDVDDALSWASDLVQRTVERFGGSIAGSIGPVTMALFGAPRNREDDPERAVRTALSIRAELAGRRGHPLTLQAAVASGETLIRHQADRTVPSVNGAVLDECHALLSTASGAEIVVCDRTRKATDMVIVYDNAIQGRARVAASRPYRVEQHVLPLIGRDTELASLWDSLDRVRCTRQAQLVPLLGDPGVGKTRLALEFGRQVGERPDLALALCGRTRPFADSGDLSAVADIVRAYCGIGPADAADAAVRKLTATVENMTSDPADARWLADRLRPLVQPAEHAAAKSDSFEIMQAVQRLIEYAADRHPLVLIIDDIHDAGGMLLDFVQALTNSQRPLPVLIVVVARWELIRRRPAWTVARHCTALTLEPLPDPAIERLLEHLATQHGLSVDKSAMDHVRRRLAEEFCSTLLDNIAGNPQFAVEFARMFWEGLQRHLDRLVLEPNNPLELDPGEVADAGQAVNVPQAVHAMIAARLDGLSPDAKAVLRAAAVVGDTVWTGAVTSIHQWDWSMVTRQLEHLTSGGLLRRDETSSVPGEQQYTFRHKLVRHVAYWQIPRAARADMHQHVAAWIESMPAVQVELLAQHYGQAISLATAVGLPTGDLADAARRVLRNVTGETVDKGSYHVAVNCYRAINEPASAWYPARLDLLAPGWYSCLMESMDRADDALPRTEFTVRGIQ